MELFHDCTLYVEVYCFYFFLFIYNCEKNPCSKFKKKKKEEKKKKSMSRNNTMYINVCISITEEA